MPQAIGLALFQLGAPLGLVNFVTLSPVFAIGLRVGITAAAIFAPRLLGTPSAPGQPLIKPTDGQQTIRQATPARWKHYGRLRVGGFEFWIDADETEGELYSGLLINQGRISEFVGFHVDEKAVSIDGSGLIENPPFDSIGARILTRLGEPTETAYSELDSAFGFDNIRGDGIATLLGIFDNFATAEDQQENYPNGRPFLRATIDASVVFDPRDADQDRDDPATWLWSENPVICLMDYMSSADGFGMPWERFAGNLDQWKEAADECDELVWSVEDGKFEKRYRIALSYLFTDDPADVLRRFEASFGGRTWQRRDGTIGVATGKFKKPTIRFGDDAVIRYNMQRGADSLAAVAGVRAQYLAPGNDYRETDATPWPDGETVLALEDDRVAALDLEMVPSHGQARRLMQAEYELANAPWRGQIITNLAGLRALDEQFIDLAISELAIDRTFRVDHMAIDLSRMECLLDVVAADEIADPARPEGIQEGLYYRGSGVVDNGDGSDLSPAMSLTGLSDGDEPQAGDLVIVNLMAHSGVAYSWSTPSGWTAINVDQTDSLFLFVSIFKIITQADIDSPPSPLSAASGVMAVNWHWMAFNPADSGSPNATLTDYVSANGGNPAPVEAIASPISVPHVLVSAFYGYKPSELTSPNWDSVTPDLQIASFDKISSRLAAVTSFFKVYQDGPGDDVIADMNAESALQNSQLISAVQFT